MSSGSNTGCCADHLRARMFELEDVRTWERNPQVYADMLASSLAGQALFTHAAGAERARRVLSKLRQTPRLIQAARDNIKEPPGIFVKVGIETMRGALKFIDDDLPRAFSSRRRSAPARRSRRRAGRSVAGGRLPIVEYLETEVGAARARVVSSRPGEVRAEAPAGRRASTVPRRPAARDRDARAEGNAGGVPVAGRQDERRRSAGGVGEDQERIIRAPGELVDVGRSAARRAARRFSNGRRSSSACRRRADHRRADAGFLPLVVREHVDARSVREQADARVLLPHRRRSLMAGRSPGRASARLQRPDALVDLDPRGVSGPLPSLSASASRRVEGAQVDAVRAGVASSRDGRTTASR